MACLAGGGGNMMMEDEMSMVQCQTSSAGRATLVLQQPLGYGVKLSVETDLGGPDPNSCMTGITLQKDF